MGLHCAAEIEHIFHRSLTSLSTRLGDKRYIMGEQLGELRASDFGMLRSLSRLMSIAALLPSRVYPK